MLIRLLCKPRRMITRNQNTNQCLWTFLVFQASIEDRIVMEPSTTLTQGQKQSCCFWGLQNSSFFLFLITAGEWFTYAGEELNLIELMVYFCIAKDNLELLFLYPFDCWDYTHGPPCLVYVVLRMEVGCSTNNWSTSLGAFTDKLPDRDSHLFAYVISFGTIFSIKGICHSHSC